jgi:hypothetical protein
MQEAVVAHSEVVFRLMRKSVILMQGEVKPLDVYGQ